MITRLANDYPVHVVCELLGCSRSTYYYQPAVNSADAAMIEVIEHIDLSRLRSFERVVFEFAKPETAVVTTPNSEYNVRFESLEVGRLRHRDHRFEWSRNEFESWAQRVAQQFGYSVRFSPVGPVDPELGAPTQMGVFTR